MKKLRSYLLKIRGLCARLGARFPVTFSFVSLLIAFCCYDAISAYSLLADIVRTLFAMLCAFALMRAFAAVFPRGSESVVLRPRKLVAIVSLVAAAGLVSGFISLFGAAAHGASCADAPQYIDPLRCTGAPLCADLADLLHYASAPRGAQLVGLSAVFAVSCMLTAMFEEFLFRGIVFKGFALGFARAKEGRPVFRAALASAAIFGILHVSGSFSGEFGAVEAPQIIEVAQMVAKTVQAIVFGFVMACLYRAFMSLRTPIALHAIFNFLAGFPPYLAYGYLASTYVTGNDFDLVAMLSSTALLAVAAVIAYRPYRRVACIL